VAVLGGNIGIGAEMIGIEIGTTEIGTGTEIGTAIMMKAETEETQSATGRSRRRSMNRSQNLAVA
jgi:hypothetical protein